MKIAAILFLFLSLAACGGTATNSNTNVPTTNSAISSTPAAADGVHTVTIDSPDGLKLVGSFYPVLYPASNPHMPALLLLHQWQSDRHSYDDFAKRMQDQGFAVLSIDGRGFGESTKTADGKTISPGRTDADVKAMLGDVGAAFDFLATQKNVDSTKIAIVGASYGSSLALIYAAENPRVSAVALLSPGLNYFGNMPTEPALKKFGKRPFYIAAADDDNESAEAVRSLAAGVNGPAHISKVFSKGGHGTSLLTSQPDLVDELKSFCTWFVLRPSK